MNGIDLYAKPQRISSKYRLKLSFDAELHSQFKLLFYDPSMVKITCNAEGDYILAVYAEDIILKQNIEFSKYFDFRDCLTVKNPLDFDVALVPVGGGWVINIGDTEVVVPIY